MVAGTAVSLVAFATHARERFVDDAAAWLRDTADQAVADLAGEPADAATRDRRRERSRAALRELAVLAAGADREARWLGRLRRSGAAPPDRAACARLMTRIASDVGSVVRAADCAPSPLDAEARRGLAEGVDAALRSAADALAGDARPRADAALARWASPAHSPSGWVAAPARLLLDDVRRLRRIGGPSSSVAEDRASA